MKHNLESNIALISQRLRTLHECVLGLQETSPSPHLIKAEAQIEAALLLGRLNFDVMLSICQSLEQYQVTAPGSTKALATDLVIDADQVLFDLPLPFVAVEDVNHVPS